MGIEMHQIHGKTEKEKSKEQEHRKSITCSASFSKLLVLFPASSYLHKRLAVWLHGIVIHDAGGSDFLSVSMATQMSPSSKRSGCPGPQFVYRNAISPSDQWNVRVSLSYRPSISRGRLNGSLAPETSVPIACCTPDDVMDVRCAESRN